MSSWDGWNMGIESASSIPTQTDLDFIFGASALPAPTSDPADFIRRLASQNQLLACLRYLGEFQVLALVPLHSSIPISELADLAMIPETLLSRVIKFTATSGFLFEVQPDQIAHTTLSAKFVSDLSFFDAIMFVAESGAPTALQMAAATERKGKRKGSNDSAFSVAFNTSKTFQSACSEQPRLQRRYLAYTQYTGSKNDGFLELLGRLNWRSMGSACVVEASAQSTEAAVALNQWNPTLQIIIQAAEPAKLGDASRYTVQRRAPGAAQSVKGAALYILRLTDASRLRDHIVAELKAHLPVLRASASSTVLLALPFVPEPGSVNADVEATARLWDLSRQQLTNEADLEVDDLVALIGSVQDARGRLAVINKLRSRTSATMAVGIKYEPNVDDLYSNTPLMG